ncbi:ATP-binding protein [Metallosphaera tengchongensis]|uniref:ATP-binding protein n=1 Tax=Metallosphaera tengchongensis TaxID=1532350 RepID=A0A6N0NXF3_9CREN|nr:ATP-binding protein [Metallosphaera tengchongensis]QKR00289.1 ATP-binding protein [Metallosphaera tengchongensis]
MIEEFNPWWMSKELVKHNEYYKKYESSPVKWDVDLNLSLEPFSLNFLFGPRQVGKSTALVLLIKKLLNVVDSPKAIFYFSCDKLADYKELDDVISTYLKLKERERINTSYIILDEVTFPKEWYRTIKSRIDNGDFKNDVLILTGSLSMKAKGEIETFPGRRGKGKTLIMYPLPFSEYVRLFGVDIPQGDLDYVIEEYYKYVPYLPELSKLFETYLVVGGFPNALKDFFSTGSVSLTTTSDMISFIVSDINKLRRSERFFKTTVKAIIDRSSSTFSFHTLSKDFSVGTVKTAISYVELLEKLFLLKVVEAIDPNNGASLFKKEKKFYLIDPTIYYAFSKWTMTRTPDETKLAEAVVITHLARLFDVYYLKAKDEVDAVVRKADRLIGFEIKYGRVRGRVVRVGKVKEFYFLSKDTVDRGVIPIPLFLAMLKVPITREFEFLPS